MRLDLFSTIRFGDTVTIIDRFGHTHKGKAVINSQSHWVLNMGGRYGTPGIANPDNVVKVGTRRQVAIEAASEA